MSFDDLRRHRREFARAIENGHYERTPTGILFPRQGAMLGGTFHTELNGRDRQLDENLIPTEGLNYLLTTAVKNGTPVATWYIALFSGNYTPTAAITAANFTATATEFTSYDESTRVEWVEGAVAAGSVDNSGSKADFTMASGVSAQVLYGAAVISASAKSATSGTLLAVSRFSSSRTVNETDVLSVQYTLSVTSS